MNIYGQNHQRKRWTRLSLLTVFLATYTSFTAGYNKRLQRWDDSRPGYCYNARLIAYPNDQHPGHDVFYLMLTFYYCLGALLTRIIYHWLLLRLGTHAQSQPCVTISFEWLRSLLDCLANLPDWPISLAIDMIAPYMVMLAMLQYPLHLYMVIALRAANEALLSGDSENEWGFGQIVALITAFSTIFECFRGVSGRLYEADEEPRHFVIDHVCRQIIVENGPRRRENLFPGRRLN